MSNFDRTVGPGRKHLNDVAGLTDLWLPEIPIIFVEGESMSMSQVKVQVHQFLVTRYPTHLAKSPASAPGEVGDIDWLASDLESYKDWELTDLTGSPHLSSLGRIRGVYGRLREACSVVDESVLSSVANTISLRIRRVEPISRTFILKVRMGALASTV